jgi:hypothetical protein
MLCEHCSKINLFLTEDARGHVRGYHHKTAGKLLESVLGGCEFCHVLYDRLEDGQVEEMHWYDPGHEEVECYLKYNYDHNWRFLQFVQAPQMRHTQVEAKSPRIRMFSFKLYANEGVSCCCSLELNWKEPVLC